MAKLLKAVSVVLAVAGMCISFCAVCVMVIVPTWGSFAAAYVGFALMGIGALMFKAFDKQIL